MIGALNGEVLDRGLSAAGANNTSAVEVLLEVAGIGYRVMTTNDVGSQLAVGQQVRLYVHHYIRENDQKLYGFNTLGQRVAFESLLSAHGVGPALALAVLATYSVERLAEILASDDVSALCEIPGVGKKTAQRLMVELKSVLAVEQITVEQGADTATPSPLLDVREALINLGYSSDEARRAISVAVEQSDNNDSGLLLKFALQELADA